MEQFDVLVVGGGLAGLRAAVEAQAAGVKVAVISKLHPVRSHSGAAHERGLSVPGELSVAGFDDSPLARHACPALTTVRQPIDEVARLATEVLMRRLRHPAEPPINYRLHAELVCRASTTSPLQEVSR